MLCSALKKLQEEINLWENEDSKPNDLDVLKNKMVGFLSVHSPIYMDAEKIMEISLGNCLIRFVCFRSMNSIASCVLSLQLETL